MRVAQRRLHWSPENNNLLPAPFAANAISYNQRIILFANQAMITGSIVAIVTPMHEDGSLDLNTFRKLLDWDLCRKEPMPSWWSAPPANRRRSMSRSIAN